MAADVAALYPIWQTEQRATCYAAANVCYQLMATIVVPVATSVEHWSCVLLVLLYAGFEIGLGIFTFWLPNETVNKALA